MGLFFSVFFPSSPRWSSIGVCTTIDGPCLSNSIEHRMENESFAS